MSTESQAEINLINQANLRQNWGFRDTQEMHHKKANISPEHLEELINSSPNFIKMKILE